MRTRAKKLLLGSGYNEQTNPAICQLVDFAAQNAGLEFGNYGNHKSYAEEARSISKDWARFKKALAEAGAEGVTDAEVIAEAPSAFSGRLEWRSLPLTEAEEGGIPTPHKGAWSYCTGQYFPTEYRKAAATLLEYATRRVRQARPPTKEKITSIGHLKLINAKNGGCWFEPSTMRFFRTRIESGIIRGKYFITSEQREDDTPRKFTVRSFDDSGDIDTVSKFHEYDTAAEALAAIPELSKLVAA